MISSRAFSGFLLLVAAWWTPSMGQAEVGPLATIITAQRPGYDITVTEDGVNTDCADITGDPYLEMRLESYVGATASASWTLRCVDLTVTYESFVTVTELGPSTAPVTADWHTRISVAHDDDRSSVTVYDQAHEASLGAGMTFGTSLGCSDVMSIPGVLFSSFREYNHVTYSP